MIVSLDIPSEWRGILSRDERILWQGAPGTDVPYETSTAFQTLFGLVAMLVIPVIIFRQIGQNNSDPGPVIMFLIGFLVICSLGWQVFGRAMFASYKLRHSFYTLTNRRAYTGWLLFGHRRLNTWNISRHTKIEYKPGFRGSVYFDEKIHHSKNSSWTEKIGFLNIRDAKAVYELMLKVQKGEA